MATTSDQQTTTRTGDTRTARAARLFDLRRVIGALLTLYGLILTVMGFFTSKADKAKAVGVNINLWAGLCILAAGLAFLAWAFTRPLQPEDLRPADDADLPPSDDDELARG